MRSTQRPFYKPNHFAQGDVFDVWFRDGLLVGLDSVLKDCFLDLIQDNGCVFGSNDRVEHFYFRGNQDGLFFNDGFAHRGLDDLERTSK